MKYQLQRFAEFLRTPFPYLFLALCIFLASTLLSNNGFVNALQGIESGERYELCLICSGPGAHDALSDIGFTVANFVLFPVTAASHAIAAAARRIEPVNATFVYVVFLSGSLMYGFVLPFLIFKGYESFDRFVARKAGQRSVFTG
ncbi:MAG: hypothetical protein HKN33_16290 [Pyrinomonadaceae bacterium]|nr:hypothetical protein [Pyrinomonadaceae bacterium]